MNADKSCPATDEIVHPGLYVANKKILAEIKQKLLCKVEKLSYKEIRR